MEPHNSKYVTQLPKKLYDQENLCSKYDSKKQVKYFLSKKSETYNLDTILK